MSSVSKIFTVALLCASLAACTPSNALKLLTGSGPNVAANGQAGKTNVQAIGQTEIKEQKLVRPQARRIVQSADDNQVSAERIENLTVKGGISIWHVLALLAWTWFWYEMPAPRHMRKSISEKWKTRRSGKS